MFSRKNGETVSLRQYVIPVILIMSTLIVGGLLMLRGIRSFHYGVLNEQSTQYARNYADRITKTAQATAAIDELLEEKLLAACRTIALCGDDINNAFLAELANSLDLEELYYYSPAGAILHSNHGRYIGWHSFTGHPVENFRLSGEDLLVEDIRADTESGKLFKYAYIRLEDGFYQIGISAEKVEALLYAFRPATLLQEIAAVSQHIDGISFLNNDFIVEESPNTALIGLQLDAPGLREVIEANETFSVVDDLEGRTLYQVYAPVIVNEEKIGSLLVTQSLRETNRLIRQTAALGIIAFCIVGLALLYALYTTYRRKKELLLMANRHSATGLPNRRYLSYIMSTSNLRGSSFLLMHIYGLSGINRTYGHRFVEGLFQDLVFHLRQIFKEQHEFFHFADNRIALFVPNELAKEKLANLAQEITDSSLELFSIMGLRGQLRTGIAIVQIEHAAYTPEQLFADAAITLLNHQENSPLPYSFYSLAMKDKLRRETAIAEELRTFLSGGTQKTLSVEYQPIIDLTTNAIVSFEALTRMQSPQLGPVSPLDFIAIAERGHLIGELDLWVLKQSCRFLHSLDQAGFPAIKVAVNVSGRELLNPDFPRQVGRLVADFNVDPSRLKLEITESVMFGRYSEISDVFTELKALGVAIAIDDFGVGYSSFARLEELDVDIIKVDKSFIDRILSKERERLIIGELVAMCHKLGLQVVAEGVEKEEQRQYLREQGCDMMQGFLFSRSLPQDLALKKLKESA